MDVPGQPGVWFKHVQGADGLIRVRILASGDATGSDTDPIANTTLHAQTLLLGKIARDYIKTADDNYRQLEAANATLIQQRDRAELGAYRGNIASATIALSDADASASRARLDACPEHLRNWEWGYLAAMLDDAAAMPGKTDIHALAGPIDWSIFVPATSTVVIATPDADSLRGIDARTGRQTLAMTAPDMKGVDSGVVARDGSRLATLDGNGTTARVWDLDRGALVSSHDFQPTIRPDEASAEIAPLRFLGTRVLIPLRFYAKDAGNDAPARFEIIEWNPDTGETTRRFDEFANCWRGISISPAGDRIVFGAPHDWSTHITPRTLIDARTGAIVAKLDDWYASGWETPALFSPDGTWLAGIVPDPPEHAMRVQFWRSVDGQPGPPVELDRSTGSVQAMRFSPDGARLALVTWSDEEANGGRFVMIDARSGKVLWSASNPGKSMDNLDFSPDGSRLVSSRRMDDPRLDVWDSADGAWLLTLPYRLGEPIYIDQKDWRAFSDDGAFLFVSDRNEPGHYLERPVVLRSRPRHSPAIEPTTPGK